MEIVETCSSGISHPTGYRSVPLHFGRGSFGALSAGKRGNGRRFLCGKRRRGLHFYAENTGVEHVTLFEMQPRLAEMSARTVALNGLEGSSPWRMCACRRSTEYTEAFSPFVQSAL